MKSLTDRVLFGLKVKLLRQEMGLSFQEMRAQSGISVSYLNEIEKGKKFPSADKLEKLARVLDRSVDQLLDNEPGTKLAPVAELLRSNFLNELPLDLFGIELAKVAEIIATAPVRVGAFISTLLELSRSYAVGEYNFYFGALRSYLELNNNYFEDLEEAAEEAAVEHRLPDRRPLREEDLRRILEGTYGYTIIDDGLDNYPDLQSLRSVFLPKEKKLLLNSQLNPIQRRFQLGKELGFQYLEINQRAYTSSLLESQMFEEVLNHSRAIYFSVALHLPRLTFVQKLKQFLARPVWEPDALLDIMNAYHGTPEMLFHRLTNVLPTHFDLGQMFFLRFVHRPEKQQFEIDKELHLSRHHHPHRNRLSEHYCRRWISISLLEDLYRFQEDGKFVQTIVGIQRSRYLGTDDEYLCITLARPSYPSPETNVSVTIGLLITPQLKRTIAFWDDEAIQQREVNKTCERCPVSDCEERAAPARVVAQRIQYGQMQDQLRKLLNN